MFLLKIKYKLAQLLKRLNWGSPKININFSMEFVILFSVTTLLSVLLVSSIYESINDIGQYKILDDENSRLEELLDENDKLLKERDFYSSKYYYRLYAREALNLAEEDQELYFVERRADINYEGIQENLDPIDVSNYRYWWYRLVF